MGRRHGAELEDAIRTAVLSLLAERGPGAVTMESVAAAARTSKPVLYRRWPDRASLLRDTLMGIATTAIPHADTGSFRGDMLAVLRGWAALFTGPQAAVLKAAVAAAAHDPELTAALRDDVIGWRKRRWPRCCSAASTAATSDRTFRSTSPANSAKACCGTGC